MASIYLRGRVWWICYYDNGRKFDKSLKTRDRTIARFKKNEIENQIAKGDNPIPNFNLSPQYVLNEYREFCRNRNKDHTVSDDISRINHFLNQCLPARIKDVSESMLIEYLNKRLDAKDIIPSTANHIITNIKTFLNFAIRKNYISINPLRNVRKYRVDKIPPKFLSRGEIKKILIKAKGETLYPMIATAIYTGMRLGELKRLAWGDIDFKRDTLTVVISKSKKFRVIPIHPRLKAILAKYSKLSGVCFELANQRRIFRRIKKRAKLPGIGWHIFRHTFASHLVMSGIDLVTVGKLLGHSDIKTTMIYSHLSPEHIKGSVSRLHF